MSKITDYLRQAADLLDVATSVLGTISGLTKNVTDDKAVVVLKAVSAAVEAALAGFSGTVTPAAVQDQLKRLIDGLAANDSAADKALQDKFAKPDNG